MIKIQLCPVGELENKNWWYLDVGVVVAGAVIFYLCMSTFLDSQRAITEQLNVKKAKWDQELASKQPALAKFKDLKVEMDKLNRKIGALRKITTSKIDKIKPIVALDQLQTLWMEGVWYESLEYKLDGMVTIKGAANDSLLVGEYLLGIRETMNPETRNDDVRTQVGFDEMALKNATYREATDDFFADVPHKMLFEVTTKHVEKSAGKITAVSFVPRPRAEDPVHF